MTDPDRHDEKAGVIRRYAETHNLDVLVETGTYKGDMVAKLAGNFRKIFSIELGKELYDKAKHRFRPFGHVNIVWGDSATMLAPVILLLDEPALFWLDAHFSGEDTANNGKMTPVVSEMEAIIKLAKPGSVVLIDDARDFVPEKGHPPLEQFCSAVKNEMRGINVLVADDIIRITPEEN